MEADAAHAMYARLGFVGVSGKMAEGREESAKSHASVGTWSSAPVYAAKVRANCAATEWRNVRPADAKATLRGSHKGKNLGPRVRRNKLNCFLKSGVLFTKKDFLE
jgi:hypothetical protein